MERHLYLFVAILIVHIVDDVEHIYIHAREPLHHLVVFVHYLVVIEILGRDGSVFRSYLLARNLVDSSVYCVKKALCKVCSRSEELHLFANYH